MKKIMLVSLLVIVLFVCFIFSVFAQDKMKVDFPNIYLPSFGEYDYNNFGAGLSFPKPTSEIFNIDLFGMGIRADLSEGIDYMSGEKKMNFGPHGVVFTCQNNKWAARIAYQNPNFTTLRKDTPSEKDESVWKNENYLFGLNLTLPNDFKISVYGVYGLIYIFGYNQFLSGSDEVKYIKRGSGGLTSHCSDDSVKGTRRGLGIGIEKWFGKENPRFYLRGAFVYSNIEDFYVNQLYNGFESRQKFFPEKTSTYTLIGGAGINYLFDQYSFIKYKLNLNIDLISNLENVDYRIWFGLNICFGDKHKKIASSKSDRSYRSSKSKDSEVEFERELELGYRIEEQINDLFARAEYVFDEIPKSLIKEEKYGKQICLYYDFDNKIRFLKVGDSYFLKALLKDATSWSITGKKEFRDIAGRKKYKSAFVSIKDKNGSRSVSNKGTWGGTKLVQEIQPFENHEQERVNAEKYILPVRKIIELIYLNISQQKLARQ